jgi:hypothetical protein
MPEPPPPPPHSVIVASVEGWLGRLDEALGEPDPAERDRLLHHLRVNIANALVALKWYQSGTRP